MKIQRHIRSVKKLELIKDKVFMFIKENLGEISEYNVREFILKEFKKESLLIDKNNSIPIVAVNSNAANPHYFPKKKSKLIRKNDLVLIDIWARVKGGYFGDITWIGYTGKKIPAKIQRTFNHVIKARDLAVGFIKKILKEKKYPKCFEVDAIVRDYFKKNKIEKYFIHGTGHSLGLIGCHGKYFNFTKKSKRKLKPMVPFTIEPGIYYKGRFGVRSEINCYVKNYTLIIIGRVQRRIVII